MRWDKRFARSDLGQRLLAWAAAAQIRLIHRTTRWERRVPPATARLLESGQPAIVAFWHGRMLVMRGAWTQPPERLGLLISGHRDGRVISRALARLGFASVTGSSRRGGAEGFRALGRMLADGRPVAITPDGPVGPRMRAKPGTIKAAQAFGVPILPVSGSASRRRLLATWDRFCLCLPFGRGLVIWGEPLTVPAEADAEALEAYRRELETRLNALTDEADRRLGLPTVAPETQARPKAAMPGRPG